MKLSLSIVSLAALASASGADAKPLFRGGMRKDAGVAAIYAQRQATRADIAHRAHVKETMKRVSEHIQQQREADDALARTFVPTSERIASDSAVTAATPAIKRASRVQIKRQGIPSGGGRRKRTVETRSTAEAIVEELERERDAAQAAASSDSTGVKRAAALSLDHKSPGIGRRAVQSDGDDSALLAETEDELEQGGVLTSFEERANYPKCHTPGARTGYAHYPGWKLIGDDLTAGLPIHPESACIEACNKYGGECAGVYFDGASKRCFLKSVHTAAWGLQTSSHSDGIDLVGGCALWSSVVPPEMDAVCCRA